MKIPTLNQQIESKKHATPLLFIIFITAIAVAFLFLQNSHPFEETADQKPDKTVEAPFGTIAIVRTSFPDRICDIRDYGAVEGGKTKNTDAFREAIEDCAARGGGRVLVPPGKWKTGPIHLRSNINLHLERDATIIFSKDNSDYLPVVFTRFEGTELYNYSALVYARDTTNIAISGKGVFDGQGGAWRDWKDEQAKAVEHLYEMARSGIPPEERIFGTTDDALRPSFMHFVNCERVSLSDFHITDSPMWTIHLLYSDGVIIDGVRIDTDGANTDGIVVDSSRNVLIDDCTLDTGDDSIALKSGLDADGWRVGRPTENVVIRNCAIGRSHAGVAVGSEMSGDVRNVFINKNSFTGGDKGFRIKSLLGRDGTVEDIFLEDLDFDGIQETIFDIDLSYDSASVEPESEHPPTIRRISAKNIEGTCGEYAVHVTGISESPVADLAFENLDIRSVKDIDLENTEHIRLTNVEVSATQAIPFTIDDSRDIVFERPPCDPADPKCVTLQGSTKRDDIVVR
jgi:polygalacturonase